MLNRRNLEVMVGWLSKILQGDRSKARRREEHDDLRGSEKTKEITLVSVDDITFDTTGFEFGKEHPTTRAWRNSAGDTVIVILQNSSPIYPVDAKTSRNCSTGYAPLVLQMA
ncbi:MAG: hypothetical protein IPG64_23435 [Haliea sp.]|nr:hypothetical protein [Haliea sp.]